jgi:hypothetical protein
MSTRFAALPNRGGMGDTNPQALASYATALQESQTPQAEWPYLWLFPSAHSRHVLYQATVIIPTYTPGTPTTAVVPLQSNTGAQTAYQVPDGMCFSVRGFVIDGDAVQSWNQGSQDLLFTLSVVSAARRRLPVESDNRLWEFHTGTIPDRRPPGVRIVGQTAMGLDGHQQRGCRRLGDFWFNGTSLPHIRSLRLNSTK